jgi:glycine betaine catabolism B
VIRRALIGGFVTAFLLTALRAGAMTAEEHASHHPGGGVAAAPEGAPSAPLSAPAAPPGTPGIAPSAPIAAPAAPSIAPAGPGITGGMGGMMGKMMAPANSGAAAAAPAPAGPSAAVPSVAGGMGGGGMGGCAGEGCGSAAAQTPIYSTLMTLPALTPQQREEINALASQQISAGNGLLATGLESLNRATQAGDNVAMQQSVGMMREGLDELGAGIAARRVLSEGKSPRNLALDWFKREMNLASPMQAEQPRGLLGVTPFHLFTMVLLIAFALAMVVMYFFKMRRAAALFGRLGPDSKPPPGSSPPLAGAPAPATHTAGTPMASAPPSGEPSSTPVSGERATKPSGKSPAPSAAGGSSLPNPPAAPGGEDAAKIAGRADELWKARGRPIGSPEIDWSQAEAELVKEAEKPPAPSAVGSSSAATVTPPVASEVPSAAPVTKNWRGRLRVGSIAKETPSVKTFRLLASSNDRFLPFTFVPGQFLNVAFWIGGARMNRSYSISSSPTHRKYVELTVRREPRGAVSRHIDDLLKVGDQVEAGGPVGKFTFTGIEADSIVLIAGGVGVTPMMSITRYLTERSWAGEIFFVYACRAPIDFIFADEVAALQHLNIKLHVAVTMSRPEGTDWYGPRGRITKELLTQTVPELASRRIHLCGPPLMMDATKAILSELGVAPDQVKTEIFGATKPTPVAPGTTAKPTTPATGPLVTFSKNNKSAKIHIDLQSGDSPPKQSILELSEELGIGIEFSCRVGTCGVCKVKMTFGEVEMEVQDALEPEDKASGIILACQAKPRGAVTVEA